MAYIILHSLVKSEDLQKNEWEELVRPYDLQILKVAEEMPEKYNILHICGEPEYQFETHVEWF